MTAETEKKCFKAENKFLVKSGCKKRMWRNLKQITTAERALPWPNDAVLCKLYTHSFTLCIFNLTKQSSHFIVLFLDYSINAPPTFKPTKKYSDISGLPAPYIDRHSKLYYSNADEFATVRSLPMDITAGYLQLRGANTIVGWSLDSMNLEWLSYLQIQPNLEYFRL